MIIEEIIELSAYDARLGLSLRGAEPIFWTIEETPLLWTADAEIWGQTAPILFPVVGWTRNGQIRHEGRTYPLGLHGFAASKNFTLVERDRSSVRLRLTDDAETQLKYPFPFQLDATYHLQGRSLVWSLEVQNTGPVPLPYAIGLHPGFCWPLAGSSGPHHFRFDRDERPSVPVIAPGGLFSTQTQSVPLVGRNLTLIPELLAQEALCFLDILSKGSVYYNDTGASLRCDFENFAHLALWSRPPAPFLCIEAWTGYGDPVGFTGEIAQKPSIRLLPPDTKARHSACFTFNQE